MSEEQLNELEVPSTVPNSALTNDIYDNPKPKITIEVISNE